LLRGERDALRILEPGAEMTLELRLTVERDGAYR
jgi:hypothetical protein